ncbi:MAG: hypothetical protein U0264_06790 [Candidatus Kapaibacterium sp.]
MFRRTYDGRLPKRFFKRLLTLQANVKIFAGFFSAIPMRDWEDKANFLSMSPARGIADRGDYIYIGVIG